MDSGYVIVPRRRRDRFAFATQMSVQVVVPLSLVLFQSRCRD
jgi:hypothetical protein